jgi:site-specific DNA-methyltransferase (adenine-specific)
VEKRLDKEGQNAPTMKNTHPTVKPIKLMEYLVKMITPPGGVVLDPFAGSGTTLIAAKTQGFNYIGIELTPEYVEIAEARLKAY